MQEQLITFETAKLAYKKGFNIQQDKSVTDDGEYNHVYIGFPAPTQSLLQKWLRKMHKIEAYALPQYGKETKNLFGYLSYVNYNKLQGFNFHEEALEDALQEALKLI